MSLDFSPISGIVYMLSNDIFASRYSNKFFKMTESLHNYKGRTCRKRHVSRIASSIDNYIEIFLYISRRNKERFVQSESLLAIFESITTSVSFGKSEIYASASIVEQLNICKAMINGRTEY